MWNGKKKDEPSLKTFEIGRYIARNSKSGITREQAAECIKLYGDLIREIFTDPNTPDDFEIPLSGLGFFKTTKKRGRKDGVVYKLRNAATNEVVEHVTQGEENRVSYILRFKNYSSTVKAMQSRAIILDNEEDKDE